MSGFGKYFRFITKFQNGMLNLYHFYKLQKEIWYYFVSWSDWITVFIVFLIKWEISGVWINKQRAIPSTKPDSICCVCIKSSWSWQDCQDFLVVLYQWTGRNHSATSHRVRQKVHLTAGPGGMYVWLHKLSPLIFYNIFNAFQLSWFTYQIGHAKKHVKQAKCLEQTVLQWLEFPERICGVSTFKWLIDIKNTKI